MWKTALLLTVSNVFMTFAWYGHLRDTSRALWAVVLLSWGIALAEYVFMVPANRIGYLAGLSGAQLRTIQEVISLSVFLVFSVVWLREPIRWTTAAGFALIALGAALIFAGGPARPRVTVVGSDGAELPVSAGEAGHDGP